MHGRRLRKRQNIERELTQHHVTVFMCSMTVRISICSVTLSKSREIEINLIKLPCYFEIVSKLSIRYIEVESGL